MTPDDNADERPAGAPGVSGQEAVVWRCPECRLLSENGGTQPHRPGCSLDGRSGVRLEPAYVGLAAPSDPASVLSRLLESDRESTVRALEAQGFVEAARVVEALRDPELHRDARLAYSLAADEVERALERLCAAAESARSHYGIEACSGPGQPATEWDAVQGELWHAAFGGRHALDALRAAREGNDAR